MNTIRLTLTPFEVVWLMGVYTSWNSPDTAASRNSLVGKETLETMLRDGVVVQQTNGVVSDVVLTPKGNAWVEHILSTPMPVQVWQRGDIDD